MAPHSVAEAPQWSSCTRRKPENIQLGSSNKPNISYNLFFFFIKVSFGAVKDALTALYVILLISGQIY